ncbi:hypothetical protein GCM10023115_33140 [Pontixanthobacter gangjinensis]|uniref:Secreted protein n=1 Tax=Christiangramia aestuarii TaxID=1028746 RepID=A0A7K1LTC9_9FLAO|nr:hypothetical protein [Christiangramia aestuarii]MUP43730.1 hypothetical protein [Christiangramia aestuarii]
MKFFSAIGIFLLLAVQSSCGSLNPEKSKQYSGIIKPAGITTYQYGTHRLETKGAFYALRSDSIDLEQYEDQKVKITATRIKGYPVDGGPVFLEVTKVKN